MQEIGSRKLVTAGKDISNPGIIGTLGMLLEVSGKGADIDLTQIPKPDLDALGITQGVAALAVLILKNGIFDKLCHCKI